MTVIYGDNFEQKKTRMPCPDMISSHYEAEKIIWFGSVGRNDGLVYKFQESN